MNTRKLLPVLVLVAACASAQLYPGARSADHLFDEIVYCARNETGKSFHTQCGKEYEDSKFAVRVTTVKTLGVNYITLFAEMGDPNQMINCSLKGGKDRDRIEKAQTGDVVELKATPSSVSFGEVTFIHFEDCALQ